MESIISQHFQKVDPTIFNLLKKIKKLQQLHPSLDYFTDLCEIVINQQLSEKAASTIFGRFKKLFPKGRIRSSYLLRLSDGQIRAAGISRGKVKYLKDLAQKVNDKVIDLKQLKNMGEEEIHKQLIQIKGIGKWSIEMFLMFSLAKEDIFSPGDLGLRKAIMKLYQLEKEPTEKELISISSKWAPFRTYASRILWRSLESKE